MPIRSKWPNEEMWEECLSWRRGGLTYSEICGRLSKPENRNRFGLKSVPSEDTVRHQVTRRLAAEQSIPIPERVNHEAQGEEARREHIRPLPGIAQRLMTVTERPALLRELGSWVLPGVRPRRRLVFWTSGWDPPSANLWTWTVPDGGPGEVQLVAEREGHFAVLREHTPDRPDAPLWQEFEDWKKGFAQLLWSCRELVTAVVQECERLTGMPLLPPALETLPQAGVFWAFAARVYYHHVSLAEGRHGLRKAYESSWRIPGQAPGAKDVWVLSMAGDVIACHWDRNVLEAVQRIHEGLLSGNEFEERVGGLVSQRRRLQETAESIGDLLHAEIELGTFSCGRCSRCP